MHSHALHQVYASYMRNHPYGTAVYRPLPYREFHPGSVGYFDTNGEWNHITDLSSPESLQADQYSPPREALQLATPDNRIEWGPKASRNIHARHTALKAGVSPAVATVLPTDASAHFTYSNATAGGALLLTTPPITRQRYYYETPFKRWVHDNAETLLRRREEITTYGLWIVCSTYATRDCAIHLWDERSREVDVGFDLGLDGVGELGPAGGWKLGSAQGGWERYSSDETDAGRVVFFGGLFFRPRRVPVGEYLKPMPRTTKFAERISLPMPASASPQPELTPVDEPTPVPDIDIPVPPTESDTYTLEPAEAKDSEEIISVDLPHENSKIEWDCEAWLEGPGS